MILPFLDLGRSVTLLEAECVLLLSPQLTTDVEGASMYEGAGELDLDCAAPPTPK